jgi:allantoicase
LAFGQFFFFAEGKIQQGFELWLEKLFVSAGGWMDGWGKSCFKGLHSAVQKENVDIKFSSSLKSI